MVDVYWTEFNWEGILIKRDANASKCELLGPLEHTT